jgi:hypothetical protein
MDPGIPCESLFIAMLNVFHIVFYITIDRRRWENELVFTGRTASLEVQLEILSVWVIFDRYYQHAQSCGKSFIARSKAHT